MKRLQLVLLALGARSRRAPSSVRTETEYPFLLQTQRRRAGVPGDHVTVVDTSAELPSGGHSPVWGRA